MHVDLNWLYNVRLDLHLTVVLKFRHLVSCGVVRDDSWPAHRLAHHLLSGLMLGHGETNFRLDGHGSKRKLLLMLNFLRLLLPEEVQNCGRVWVFLKSLSRLLRLVDA